MAKIQAIGVGQKISTDVQVAKQDPRAAGMVWGAVGAAAGKAAEVAGAFVEKAEAAEATDYSLNKSLEYQGSLKDLERTLKPKYANNPDGYAKEYEEEAVKLRNRISEEAPSDRARQGFMRNTDAALLSGVTKGYAQEQSDKVYNYVKGFDTRASTLANNQYKSPDPVGAKLYADKEMLNIEEQVGAGLLDRRQADGLVENLNKQVTIGFLSGMEANNYGGIVDPNATTEQKAKALDAYLSGDSKNPSLLNDLDPQIKLKFKEDALRSFRRQDLQRAKEAEASLDRAIKGILTGEVNPTSPDGFKTVQEQMRGLASNNSIDAVLKEDMMKKLTKTVTDTEIKKRLALGDDVEKLTAGVAGVFDRVQAGLGTSMATDIGQRAAELKSELDVEFAKSPADFVAKYDPALAATKGAILDPDPRKAVAAFDTFKSRADALFDERNTPDTMRTYLPKDVAKGLKSRFDMALEAGNYEQVGDLFTQFEAMGRGNGRGLMKEIGVPERYMAIGEVSDKATRTRLFSLTDPERRKELDDTFKNRVGNGRDINTKLELMDDPYYKDLQGFGMYSDQSVLNANSVLESVDGLYRMERVKGASADEARATAWDAFKKDKTLIKGTTGDNIILPKDFSPTAARKLSGLVDVLRTANLEDVASTFNLKEGTRPEDVAARATLSFNPNTNKVHLVSQAYDSATGKITTFEYRNAQDKPIAYSAEELETLTAAQAYMPKDVGGGADPGSVVRIGYKAVDLKEVFKKSKYARGN